jgi:hypothetical protein
MKSKGPWLFFQSTFMQNVDTVKVHKHGSAMNVCIKENSLPMWERKGSGGMASIRLQVTCYKSPSPPWGEGWGEGSQFLDLKFELCLEFGFWDL